MADDEKPMTDAEKIEELREMLWGVLDVAKLALDVLVLGNVITAPKLGEGLADMKRRALDQKRPDHAAMVEHVMLYLHDARRRANLQALLRMPPAGSA